jgi:hypothetical protein
MSFMTYDSNEHCQHLLSKAILTHDVLTIHESVILEVSLFNSNTRDTCITDLNISATEFKVDPSTVPEKIILPPLTPIIIRIVVSASQLGKQKIVVSSGLESITISTRVINIFGLGPRALTIISASVGFLGAALSFPWLLDKWLTIRQKRKKQKKKLGISDIH